MEAELRLRLAARRQPASVQLAWSGEDGALKPQIVAPGAAISTIPLWQNGSPVVGTYTLPPGYGMFNGTSMAAPQAAGAAALLISAAKQERHVPDYGAAQLRTVFNSTARFIDRYNASDEGNGLIDVDKAWKLLKKGVDPVNITSRVAVHTLLSDLLEEPGFGPGIYDREGVTVGQRVHPHVHVHADIRSEPPGTTS